MGRWQICPADHKPHVTKDKESHVSIGERNYHRRWSTKMNQWRYQNGNETKSSIFSFLQTAVR